MTIKNRQRLNQRIIRYRENLIGDDFIDLKIKQRYEFNQAIMDYYCYEGQFNYS